jgi:hypothetical protein
LDDPIPRHISSQKNDPNCCAENVPHMRNSPSQYFIVGFLKLLLGLWSSDPSIWHCLEVQSVYKRTYIKSAVELCGSILFLTELCQAVEAGKLGIIDVK